MTHRSRIKYSILTALGLGVFTVGVWMVDLPALSLAGFLILVLVSASFFAHTWGTHLRGTRLVLGAVASLSVLMILGSIVYYAGFVTVAHLFAVAIALPFIGWLTAHFLEESQFIEEPEADTKLTLGLCAALFVVSLLVFALLLAGSSTTDAVRSPWLVASPLILLAIASAGFWLLGVAARAHTRLAIVGSICLLAAVLSVAIVVFPLGYGFDSFLHQAALDHIALNGTITPKPLYYIGQYALELFVMLFGSLDAHTVDVALLPILAALLLPSSAAAAVWQITKRGVPTAFAAVATAMIPLSTYINTTPQGLSYLWFLLLLFLALPELITGTRWTHPGVLILVALATLLVHPLTGIPAILFLLLYFASQRQSLLSTLYSLLTLLGAIALPVAFALFGDSTWHFQWNGLDALVPSTFFSTRFNAIGDLVSWITLNGWLWLIAFAAAATVILWKMRSKRWRILPLLALILAINAMVLSITGDFSFLIDYEQTNYIDRVVYLCLHVLLPLSVLGIGLVAERLISLKRPLIRFALIALLGVAIGANAYTAYPRHDTYTVSRGFTVAQSDHHTVASIASHASDEPYIVLANQTVSAAAIQDNGFLHYYGAHSDVFYYPVPTGGPLYQIFLRMIEENPTRALAVEAMDVARVDRAYFVVNDYWWSAETAIERARAQTDEYFVIDDGATWVFVFDRTTDKEITAPSAP